MMGKKWFVCAFIFYGLSALSSKEPLLDKQLNDDESDEVELDDASTKNDTTEAINLLSHLNVINENYIKLSDNKICDTDQWISNLTQELGKEDFLRFVIFFKNFKEHLEGEYSSCRNYKEKQGSLALICLVGGSTLAGGILAGAGIFAFIGGLSELSLISCNEWHCSDGLHKVDTSPWACYSGPTDRDCAQLYLAQFPYGAHVSPEQVVYISHCGEGWTAQMNDKVIPFENYHYDVDDHCRKLAGAIPFIPAEGLVIAAVGTEALSLVSSGFFLLRKFCHSQKVQNFAIDPETSALLRKVQGLDIPIPEEVNAFIKQAFKRAGGVEECFDTGVDDPLLEAQQNQNRGGFLKRFLGLFTRKATTLK